MGTLSRIATQFYLNLRGALFLVREKTRSLSGFLLLELNKESASGARAPDTPEATTDQSQADLQKAELDRANALLENTTKNVHRLVRRLGGAANDLKEALSHRLCYPKVAGGMFLPFSGGTNQMVHLTACLTALERDLSRITELRVNSCIKHMFTSLKILSREEWRDFKSCTVQTHATIAYVSGCNETLAAAQPRIKLANLEHDLHVAKNHEHELAELRTKFADTEEMLALATRRAENHERELERLRQTDVLEAACTRAFRELAAKYDSHILGGADNDARQLEAELKEANDRVKKLTAHVKQLLKTLTTLEDTNNQLKLSLDLNRNQYKLAKENEDAIHRNYNEQLVLMSEHISELNNVILSSEYKIAELTQTKVSCPSCGFNNTLGSMMGVDDKGRCSSCRCLLIYTAN